MTRSICITEVGGGAQELDIPNNTYDSHNFAVIHSNNEVVGYISYAINYASKVVDRVGIISFKPSECFGRDLIKVIDDIFMKYNMNKIEFRCYDDNPVMRHYVKFINRYEGSIAGVLHKSIMLEDGRLHDTYLFELFRDNYIRNKHVLKKK